jgi:hypothetical protein
MTGNICVFIRKLFAFLARQWYSINTKTINRFIIDSPCFAVAAPVSTIFSLYISCVKKHVYRNTLRLAFGNTRI